MLIMKKHNREDVLRQKILHFIRVLGVLREQAPCGLPISISAAHALMYLKNEGKGVVSSQQELQQALDLDKSNVARLCLAMQKQGLILQRSVKADRRYRQVFLTKKGDLMAQKISLASRVRMKRILSHLPKNQFKSILRTFDVMAEAIEIVNENKDATRKRRVGIKRRTTPANKFKKKKSK